MRKPSEAFQPPRVGGGAKGIRTPDLYNANVARYQLCYSPLFGNFSDHILHLVGFRCLRGGSAQVAVRSTNCANAPGVPRGTEGSITQLKTKREPPLKSHFHAHGDEGIWAAQGGLPVAALPGVASSRLPGVTVGALLVKDQRYPC